jgi:hypothetical protein
MVVIRLNRNGNRCGAWLSFVWTETGMETATAQGCHSQDESKDGNGDGAGLTFA